MRGRILQAEGPQAPTPPGVTALPKAGEVVVSPALKKLLDSPDNQLFAPRLGGATVIATIGADGLAGPHELAFYLGSDTLSDEQAQRIDAFGHSPMGPEFGPMLMLLVVIIFVVLLLPIVVFLGAAVRFGGERRDRRMAALRLVGADGRMIRRIAAGEAAAGALLGVAVGGVLFAIGRQVAPLVTLRDISVFASDIRPSLPLVLAIVVAMPALAVAVGLITLRGVVIEPLGVSRRTTGVRRRLWWRLVVPGIGLALLYPLIDRTDRTITNQYQIAAGAVLLLIGAVILLPWLIDLVVRPMRGGSVPWQLAVRRLQIDSATSARMVNGIAVAVAGTIGLQMLFAVVQAEYTVSTRHDVSRAQAHVYVFPDGDPVQALARLKSTQGVTGGAGTLWTTATAPATAASASDTAMAELGIGDCAALAEFADIDSCVNGDVFIAQGPEGPSLDAFVPGARLTVGGEEGRSWRLPADIRRVPSRTNPNGWQQSAILVTPGAIEVADLGRLRVNFYATTDPSMPDTLEHLRNMAASITPLSQAYALQSTIPAREFVNIQRGLYIGSVVTLLLISVSLLVGVLEQLRERRRLLAMLIAVGTPRGTLTWSVLWQTLVPVLLGLVLAVVFGLGLGGVLLGMVGRPMTISWPVVGVSTGLAAAVVLLLTLLSLPALRRLMHPDGLRTE